MLASAAVSVGCTAPVDSVRPIILRLDQYFALDADDRKPPQCWIDIKRGRQGQLSSISVHGSRACAASLLKAPKAEGLGRDGGHPTEI